jgi:acetyltransferase-like isoleucine patch superfamily enzyme
VLGKGAILCAYSQLRGTAPDFAVMAGQPARQVGDTRERDAALLARHPELREAYEAWAGRATP